MSLFDRFMESLKIEMTEPNAFGWFHLLCIGIMIVFIIFLYIRRQKHSEKQLKIVIGGGVIKLGQCPKVYGNRY